MGGGGFSMEPDNPALDHFVIESRAPRESVGLFSPRRRAMRSRISIRSTAAFRSFRAGPTHVPLFARTPDLETVLLEQDVIYVGGGNTKSMLAVWREWDMPAILRRAWQSGPSWPVSAPARSAGSKPDSPIPRAPASIHSTGLGFLPAPAVLTTTAKPNAVPRCIV